MAISALGISAGYYSRWGKWYPTEVWDFIFVFAALFSLMGTLYGYHRLSKE
jgi:hypothetical protein